MNANAPLNSKGRPFRTRVTSMAMLIAFGSFLSTAFADPPGRVVVVAPNGQQQQPLGPNEHVVAGKTVLINGQPTTVVRVEQFPPKPKFVIGMPLPIPPGVMVYFPFPPDHVDNGVTVGKRAFPTPGGGVTVVSTSCVPGVPVCEGCKIQFPPGSVIIPDPPQPPGLMFFAPQAPVDPPTEVAVLQSLGLPDNPWAEVFEMTAGDMFFFINGNPPGPPVQFRPAFHAGDMNCDGIVDGLDIEGFARAITDAPGYTAALPSCGYFYADVNADSVVNAADVIPFIELVMGS